MASLGLTIGGFCLELSLPIAMGWRDAPVAYGSHKTPYGRWKRCSEKGIFARMLVELADQGGNTDPLMIDATHLKTHRTASSLGLKKGGVAV